MKSASNIKQILAFLRQLQANNDRTWFKARKQQYDDLRKPWEQDMERLIGLVAEFDEGSRGLQVKECVYRIYRDTRFSHDKSPYKNYFSGVIGKGGRHTVVSCYYVHFQPDQLMMGGGLWWPPKDVLTRVRSLLDAEPDEFLKIVQNPEFASRYHWECDTLKKVPKEYPADHPLAQYLKMKEFIAMMRPDEDYFDCDDWVERVAADLRPLQPLHDFINYVFD